MKISYCSPSYRRSVIKTADYLPYVKVFVDKQDAKVLKDKNYNLEVVPDGVQGNLPRVRNYILDHEFDNGADAVVIMDDDVSYCQRFYTADNGWGYAEHKIDKEEFRVLCEKYALLTKEWGLGAYSWNNNTSKVGYRPFQPFCTHSLCLGPFICHVENELRYDENLPLKEDYDMYIQQQNRYRGMLCISHIHYQADIGVGTGGTAVRRNLIEEKKQQDLLIEKWGNKIVKAKSGHNKTLYGNMCQDINIPIKGV